MNNASETSVEISVKNLNLWFGKFQALKNISIDIQKNQVTALIGPSGCGKSTFIKTLDRMNDLVDNGKITGEVVYQGRNILDSDTDVVELRKQIGMVFQKPNPFPKSIFDNVAYGPLSYTHLRAHETPEHLVCRLLL